MNKDWLPQEERNPKLTKVDCKLSNQAQGVCLKPYNALWSLTNGEEDCTSI